MKPIKTLVKSRLRALGYELQKVTPRTNAAFQVAKALDAFQIDLVFDIGANTGQFASSLRSFGYNGDIVSFEPLSAAHKALVSSAAKDERWQVHQRGAVGDVDGEVTVNVAANSVSSSVLPMLSSHAAASPDSAYVTDERTPMFRFDSEAPDYLFKDCRPLIKVDTQGFEWQVLDGARETLPSVIGILCELSIVPLYEGQRLWLDMISRLEQGGFTLWSIQPGFTDSVNGRTLQVDGLFFRL